MKDLYAQIRMLLMQHQMLSDAEILAVISFLLGALLAMQDQLSHEEANSIVKNNIHLGSDRIFLDLANGLEQ